MDKTKKYIDSNGVLRNIWEMVRLEPEWVVNRFQEMEKQLEVHQVQAQQKDSADLDETWICNNCGTFHSSLMCTNCGISRR